MKRSARLLAFVAALTCLALTHQPAGADSPSECPGIDPLWMVRPDSTPRGDCCRRRREMRRRLSQDRNLCRFLRCRFRRPVRLGRSSSRRHPSPLRASLPKREYAWTSLPMATRAFKSRFKSPEQPSPFARARHRFGLERRSSMLRRKGSTIRDNSVPRPHGISAPKREQWLRPSR